MTVEEYNAGKAERLAQEAANEQAESNAKLASYQQRMAHHLTKLLPDDAPSSLLWSLLVDDASDDEAKRRYDEWHAEFYAPKPPPKCKGQKPLGFGRDFGLGAETFDDQVGELMRREGIGRRVATKRLFRVDGEARQAFIASCPPGRNG